MLRRVVYQYWTGGGMSQSRKECFDATRDVFGVPVELVTDDNVSDYVVPGHPLHPSFGLLSANHRSDYIRCYLLRFHGGGWADIKKYSEDNNWAESFDRLDSTPGADVLGEAENVGGMAFGSMRTPECAGLSIITSYLVAKADTPFTKMWYERTVRYLDMVQPLIYANPSTSSYGGPSYPLRFYSVMGEPFHYTCVKMGRIRPGSVLRSLRSGRMWVPYR